jgi:hypothetical protein
LKTAEAETAAAQQQEKTRKRELGRLKGATINTLAKALENGTAWRAVAKGLRAKVKSAETQALFQALAKRLLEDLLWTRYFSKDPEEAWLLVDQWLSRYVDDYASEHTALEIARRRFEPIQTWSRLCRIVSANLYARTDIGRHGTGQRGWSRRHTPSRHH